MNHNILRCNVLRGLALLIRYGYNRLKLSLAVVNTRGK